MEFGIQPREIVQIKNTIWKFYVAKPRRKKLPAGAAYAARN